MKKLFLNDQNFYSFFQLFIIFRMSPSFNKEVYVDFMAAQIKTLSFLAYIVRIYQVLIKAFKHSIISFIIVFNKNFVQTLRIS